MTQKTCASAVIAAHSRVHTATHLARHQGSGCPKWNKTYVEGWVPHGTEPGAWTDEQLRHAARLLRTFHDAMADSALAGADEDVGPRTPPVNLRPMTQRRPLGREADGCSGSLPARACASGAYVVT